MRFSTLFRSLRCRFRLAIFALPVALFCAFFSGCADEASSASRLDDSFRDFSRILSKGDSVKLEATGLISRFSYDFYIAAHEVTQGEYFRVTGVPFAEGKENFPVANVTFYDAVLYANALSLSMKLDTVYEWTSKALDADGKCTYLDGFRTDYSANGYRLPTEAEWVYAAKSGWNPKSFGWNSENSDYASREVCTIGKNSNGICDMAGNVLEWTGDWMSGLGDTVVTDFVGGNAPNSLNEIIVKGGSFRNAPENISLKNRGDVYTVTPSMSADYVGFRLVRGAIGEPDFADNQDQKSDYDITVLSKARTLKNKVGTFVSTLAFRDDETGNIGFVRFASSNPQAIEIADTLDAYHPAISPDGKRVAFCTRPEGISGKSELYVRDLDAKGSNLVKLDAESAAIPRWRVVGADTQIVYVTSAGNNADAADWKRGSTWAVPFSGGKFGTPEKLFDGTYNGGVSADGNLAVSGARLLRANANGKESVWYSGEQACNASLSDTAKRTLFLDFGGETGKSFAGKGYDAHEMLLVADSSGMLSKMVPAPAGYAFDHTEWVRGREDFAVATLTNADGAHSKIALVNVADSSVLELAEGRELWHPDLWVAESSSQSVDLDPDSAGVYFSNASGTLSDRIMRYNMELLWRYKDSANVVVLGSSRPLDGVSPAAFSDSFFVINLAQTPNTIYFSWDWLQKYIYPHVKKLKYLIISLDIDFWWKTAKDDAFDSFLKYPGYLYDKNHQYWMDDVPEELLTLTENAPGNQNDEAYLYSVFLSADRGRAFMNCISWGGDSVEIVEDTLIDEAKPKLIENSFAELKQLVEFANERKIFVVGVIFPQNPAYKSTGAYGRYGLRRSSASKLIERLKALENSYSNFILMDENKMGNHDYSDSLAMDFDHLCDAGAKRLSSRLDSLLKTLK